MEANVTDQLREIEYPLRHAWHWTKHRQKLGYSLSTIPYVVVMKFLTLATNRRFCIQFD